MFLLCNIILTAFLISSHPANSTFLAAPTIMMSRTVQRGAEGGNRPRRAPNGDGRAAAPAAPPPLPPPLLFLVELLSLVVLEKEKEELDWNQEE